VHILGKGLYKVAERKGYAHHPARKKSEKKGGNGSVKGRGIRKKLTHPGHAWSINQPYIREKRNRG